MDGKLVRLDLILTFNFKDMIGRTLDGSGAMLSIYKLKSSASRA